MNFKIISLLIFQIALTLSHEPNFDSGLNILKASATIRFARPLKPGDVMIVKGTFADTGTEASFDIENDHCDWTNWVFDNCIEYNLWVQFHANKMFRKIFVNGTWKHDIDTYYLRPVKPKTFKYTFKVKKDHFEADLFGYDMAPMNFTEPIDTLSTFRLYGYGNVEQFILKHQKEDAED
ncbi:uncharacterized protein LOC129618541 [Condylostylus longicornis]|uniref:uncharacterized protein LOC129618541 n=1 Tax=Condylostylus longicornis TaxID=2530218 RepID=UPI00244E35DC|nr:uncharacterized protein LOC129618541 [Condylostylus longicornis]